MKIKIFCDTSVPDLEKEVNQWLLKNNVEIHKILQSESSGGAFSMTITIVYRERNSKALATLV